MKIKVWLYNQTYMGSSSSLFSYLVSDGVNKPLHHSCLSKYLVFRIMGFMSYVEGSTQRGAWH